MEERRLDDGKRKIVEEAARKLVDEWISDETWPDVTCADDLNWGPCWDFAEELAGRLEEAGIEARVCDTVDLLAGQGLQNGDYHAWVEVEGMAFDGTCVEGAPATCLKTTARILRQASPITEDEPEEELADGPRP